MRLVFLNTLNGQIKKPITDFINEQCLYSDIFCFQEADKNMEQIAKECLHDYCSVSDHKYLSDFDQFHQITYFNNGTKNTTSKTLLSNETNTGLCLYSQLQNNKNIINVCNVHGIARPGNKLDTPGRLKQSQVIIDFLKNIDGPKIIGGDFNLEFNTQSVKLFEENGYRNLIKEYKVSTTRNKLSWDQYPDSKQYFADYLFVTPDIKILNFSVPSIEVSDHLPLILEIDIVQI